MTSEHLYSGSAGCLRTRSAMASRSRRASRLPVSASLARSRTTNRLLQEALKPPPQRYAIPKPAFPHDENVPTQDSQPLLVQPVAPYVTFELRLPVVLIAQRLRPPASAPVPVPEAPMHQDHLPVTGQNYVGTSRQIVAMETEPIPHLVEHPPDYLLGHPSSGADVDSAGVC